MQDPTYLKMELAKYKSKCRELESEITFTNDLLN